MCVYLYIRNNYTQHTQIYYVNTNFYFGLIAINLYTALIYIIEFCTLFNIFCVCNMMFIFHVLHFSIIITIFICTFLIIFAGSNMDKPNGFKNISFKKFKPMYWVVHI